MATPSAPPSGGRSCAACSAPSSAAAAGVAEPVSDRRTPKPRALRRSRRPCRASRTRRAASPRSGRRHARRGPAPARPNRRPSVGELLLTPANARRVTDQLAQLRRGHEMGQLLSMDAGDLLPPNSPDILVRLRARRPPVPREPGHGAGGQLGARLGETVQALFPSPPWPPPPSARCMPPKPWTGSPGHQVQYRACARAFPAMADNVAALLRLSGLPAIHAGCWRPAR